MFLLNQGGVASNGNDVLMSQEGKQWLLSPGEMVNWPICLLRNKLVWG